MKVRKVNLPKTNKVCIFVKLLVNLHNFAVKNTFMLSKITATGTRKENKLWMAYLLANSVMLLGACDGTRKESSPQPVHNNNNTPSDTNSKNGNNNDNTPAAIKAKAKAVLTNVAQKTSITDFTTLVAPLKILVPKDQAFIAHQLKPLQNLLAVAAAPNDITNWQQFSKDGYLSEVNKIKADKTSPQSAAYQLYELLCNIYESNFRNAFVVNDQVKLARAMRDVSVPYDKNDNKKEHFSILRNNDSSLVELLTTLCGQDPNSITTKNDIINAMKVIVVADNRLGNGILIDQLNDIKSKIATLGKDGLTQPLEAVAALVEGRLKVLVPGFNLQVWDNVAAQPKARAITLEKIHAAKIKQVLPAMHAEAMKYVQPQLKNMHGWIVAAGKDTTKNATLLKQLKWLDEQVTAAITTLTPTQ